MALEAGADDTGLIDLSRETMAEYRQDLFDAMPDTQSMMVLVFRVNPNHLRSLAHSPLPRVKLFRYGSILPLEPRPVVIVVWRFVRPEKWLSVNIWMTAKHIPTDI
ncbi:MAG: hypothetical protein PVG08_14600 [Desulfobacterales bacterium]